MKKVLTLILLFIFFSSLCSCKDSNYDNNQQNLFDSIVEEETEDIIEFYLPRGDLGWGSWNYWGAIIKKSSELYHYDIFCDNGAIITDIYLKNYLQVINDFSDLHIINWIPTSNGDTPTGNEVLCEKAYLTIIQKYNNNIIGYVIFEFIQDKEFLEHQGVNWIYSCNLIKQKRFPKVNGVYQSVSKEYIFKKLAEVKDEM